MGKTNGLAIASLVLGLVGLCVPLCPLLAVIFGAIALSQISKTGQEGKGMAIAGLILGIVKIALGVLWVILNFALNIAFMGI
jgi:hypothetical protein